jgi:hypothetical protein
MSFNSKYTGEQVESILDNILTEDKVRLIHFETREEFEIEVANGNILDNSIVFIEDTKEIWNHGTYFPSGRSIEEIENIIKETITIPSLDGYAKLEDIPVIPEFIVDNVTISAENGVINLGYVNKELVTSTSSYMTLSPNVYYRNTNTSLSSLTINFDNVSNDKIVNEYLVEFTTSSNGTTILLPSSIKWENGKMPLFDNNTTYQISVINNLGVCIKFS